MRIKIVFYAGDIENNQSIEKKIANSESEESRWVNLIELLELRDNSPGWRGTELYLLNF